MSYERVEALHFKGPTSEDAWWGGVWHHIGAKEETCDVQRVPKQFTLIFFLNMNHKSF